MGQEEHLVNTVFPQHGVCQLRGTLDCAADTAERRMSCQALVVLQQGQTIQLIASRLAKALPVHVPVRRRQQPTMVVLPHLL
jgi:hypothetical protein